ncbi:MAG: DNA polymerase III subunit delta' [Kiloniellales bacterium]|nr:DNA polymerase III subunit delta' [Kiloniellales bacterium]
MLEPRENPELIGQTAAEAVLLQAAGEGRLAHAWLLTGPRGIGKATLAYRFARHLLAKGEGSDREPGLFGAPEPPIDGLAGDMSLATNHPVFRRVASGGHPDLKVLETGINEQTGRPRTEITVDQVRKATDFLRLTAAEGGWRIVLVDSADALNANAANALLKILEEPSRHSLLLLVSHAPGRLLPTVRSRCCHLALRPLPDAAVCDLLRRGRPDLEDAEAATLARLAEGSIGRALELAEVGGLELYGELVALLAGLAGEEDAPARGLDSERLHGFTDKLARGSDLGAFRAGRDLFLWWLARTVRARTLGRAPALVTDGEGPVLAGLAKRGSLAEWLALWDKVSHLLTRVESANLDRKQALLAAFLELESMTHAR